jgi:hypothetical protein
MNTTTTRGGQMKQTVEEQILELAEIANANIRRNPRKFPTMRPSSDAQMAKLRKAAAESRRKAGR